MPPTDLKNKTRHSPLVQLVRARLVEFLREPEALFWVYGFPVLMVVTLGIAFREKPVEKIVVDVEAGLLAKETVAAFEGQKRFVATVHDEAECRLRLRTGRTDVIVKATPQEAPSVPDASSVRDTEKRYDYFFDPARPESLLARNAVDDALQRAAGRKDVSPTADHEVNEPGARYIDFLVPGLLGMSLMGGGMFGVGFVTVDMRIRKLLKRFIATPMKKGHFLGGIMISRLVFLVPEVLLLLVFARVAFGVVNHGSALAVAVLILLGAVSFAGLGLLVASRANTLEAVSGLMNLIMLPMWVLSGIFFSSDRFPDMLQPVIKVLPLTLIIDSLRSVMLEGASLAAQTGRMGILAAWAAGTFALALKWFRWS